MRTLSIILAVLLLASLSAVASAAPSRLLLETIVDEDVTLTLTSDEEVLGKVIRVLDDGVIFIQDSGDVLELAIGQIRSARVARDGGVATVSPPAAQGPAVAGHAASSERTSADESPTEPPVESAEGRVLTLEEAVRLNAERSANVRPLGAAPPPAPLPAPAPARGLSSARPEPDINSYGKGLRTSGVILLVSGAGVSTVGTAMLVYGLRNGDAYYSDGVVGAVMIIAALPAVAVGTTLLILGKNKRARAAAAAAQALPAVTVGPSFAQGRPGAQVGFTF